MLKRIPVAGCIAIGVLLGALMAGAPAASAHDNGFYQRWWYPIGIDDVPVRFDDDFPNGRTRLRVTDGARQWNDLGRRMYFKVDRKPSINSGGDSYRYRAQAHCPTPEVGGRRVGMMHWSSLSSGILAATALCWKGDVGGKSLKSFRIHFNRHIEWYTRRGDSRVRNRRTGRYKSFFDFWSVATHEFGHASGWVGHWYALGDYCNYSKPASIYRTMCPGGERGYERERTLEGSDKHVFRSHYGPR